MYEQRGRGKKREWVKEGGKRENGWKEEEEENREWVSRGSGAKERLVGQRRRGKRENGWAEEEGEKRIGG